MMAEWTTFALYWYAPRRGRIAALSIRSSDGRSRSTSSRCRPGAPHRLADDARRDGVRHRDLLRRRRRRLRALSGRRGGTLGAGQPWRGLSCARCGVAACISRCASISAASIGSSPTHTIFTGVTYTDAHVTLTGLLVVAVALVVGAGSGARQRRSAPRARWLVAAVVPAVACYVVRLRSSAGTSTASSSSRTSWCASSPYIAHNIEMTRQAFGLDRIAQQSVSRRCRRRSARRREQPGDAREHPAVGLARAAGHAAADSGDPHLLRLPRHRHRPLRTRRHRPPDDARGPRAEHRQLPESSRNWINEKLIYTHGYGVTMNPVNGFTPEGLPTLLLANMPVQSTIPALEVTGPKSTSASSPTPTSTSRRGSRNSTTRRAKPTA